jgi:hypothetical protein
VRGLLVPALVQRNAPKKKSNPKVTSVEITSDPKQPIRFEKKKNATAFQNGAADSENWFMM